MQYVNPVAPILEVWRGPGGPRFCGGGTEPETWVSLTQVDVCTAVGAVQCMRNSIRTERLESASKAGIAKPRVQTQRAALIAGPLFMPAWRSIRLKATSLEPRCRSATGTGSLAPRHHGEASAQA